MNKTSDIAEVKTENQISNYNPNELLSNPATFRQMYKNAELIAGTNLIPKNYRNKPADIVVAMDMANRVGVPALMVMQSLYVIEGMPSWSGQACAVLIKNSTRFADVGHIRTGEKGKMNRGCYYYATDTVTGEVVKGVEVTMQMAKDSGWIDRRGSSWRTIPEMMLNYRAASFFAKEYCPEVLMGVPVQGEVIDSNNTRVQDATAAIFDEEPIEPEIEYVTVATQEETIDRVLEDTGYKPNNEDFSI